MKNDYIVRTLYRSFVAVSILTAITATVGMLIDNIVVGQALGSDALGAMGIVAPVSLVLSAFGNICSGGGTARAAQAIGRGDRAQVNRIFTATMLFVLVSGALLTIAGLAFTPQLAALLGARGELLLPTEQYLYGYFLGAFPTILMTALMGFVRIDGSPRLPLVCMAVMTGANILLDLLFTLALRMDMFGMALATTLSYTLACLAACTHFLKKSSGLRLVQPFRAAGELPRIVGTGAPTALGRVCMTLRTTLLNNLMVTAIGASAVAVLNVRTQAYNILGALAVGIGQAALPVVGMFFGEEDRTALRDTLRSSLRIGLLLNCSIAVLLLVFPSVFPSLLGLTDPNSLAMANNAIRLFALSMPLSLLNTILCNFYQSTRRTALSTALSVLQSLVYTTLFAFLLLSPMGSDGVWLAFLLGEVFTLLTALGYAFFKNRRFSFRFDDLMLLPADFGGDPKDQLELSIGNSMDEVMTISAGIGKFARGRNIDAGTVSTLSLLIEEMAGNVVQHAFRPGEKKWFDLLLLDRPDSVLVRLRDNGSAFDPTTYQDADGQSYGIRLVRGLSDDFRYRRSMGLNVLMITVRKNRSA